MVRKIALALFASFLVVALRANAQTPPSDPIRDALLPPDFVMEHQQELGLSDHQKKAIVADVQAAQDHFARSQKQIEAAKSKLVDILSQSRIDQAKALAQMDAVLDVEREIKHAQLTLMVQIKNELTAEQQATAHKLEAGTR
jgi:Spy/CpxP family protein refolding chaperone